MASEPLPNFIRDNNPVTLLSATDVLSFCARVDGLQKPLSIVQVSNAYANLVWRVTCPTKTVYVKQFLPYLRKNPSITKQPGSYVREKIANRYMEKIFPRCVPTIIFYDDETEILVTESYDADNAVTLDSIDFFDLNYSQHVQRVTDLLLDIQAAIAENFLAIPAELHDHEFLNHQYKCLMLDISYTDTVYFERAKSAIEKMSTLEQSITFFDVSPKNLLVGTNQIGLCDLETTCTGSAIFDFAHFFGTVLYESVQVQSIELALEIISTALKSPRMSSFVKKTESFECFSDIVVCTLLYKQKSALAYNHGIKSTEEASASLTALVSEISNRTIRFDYE